MFEIIVPTVLFILCAILQSDAKSSSVDAQYYYIQDEVDYRISGSILYAPNSSFANNLIAMTVKNSSLISGK